MGFTATLAEDLSTAGSRRYLAPESLEGKPATVRADLCSLGVVLYQMVVGDFTRTMGPGWRRDVDDEILAEDIGRIVDRSPEHRPENAYEVVGWLRTLDERRDRRRAEAEARAARAEREHAEARLISELLMELFELSEPGESPDRGEIFTEDPRGAGLHRLALVLEAGGDAQTAEQLLRRSLHIQRRELGELHPDVAASLNNLGLLLYRRGEQDAAVELLRQSVEKKREIFGDDHSEVAEAAIREHRALRRLTALDYSEALAEVARTHRLTGLKPEVREALLSGRLVFLRFCTGLPTKTRTANPMMPCC